MALTDNLRRQHGELVKLAGDLAAAATSPASLNAAAARSALNKLAGVLKIHLAMEDSSMYPRLLGHKDAALKTMAKKYQDEMGGLAAAFTTYTTRWSSDAMQADPAEFVKQTKGVIAALAARIEAENTELYARADSLGL